MRPSVQGVDPPVCCVLDVTVTYARDSFVDSQAGPFVLSRGGGPRYPGTRLTVPSSGTVLGHSQGSLQCHFSRCKVVLCLEDDVLYQVHRVDQGLCSVFIKGVVPPWGDLCVLWHSSEDVDLAHRKVLCHFQAKLVISRTGQSSICERIHLTDDTPLCMRHLNSI